mmetsp:Transcript_56549/g.132652  ORF Transcript_56549/g.132652 Transcript_56549/m.132652 type:complete len:304 (-) Transcript_56549:179-1090(-)
MSGILKLLLVLSLQASCSPACLIEDVSCHASQAPALLQVAFAGDRGSRGASLSDLETELERLLNSADLVDAGECDLCGGNQSWLFVIGTGRSGSTSLMSMLNAIPGIHISGENWGAIESLKDFYHSVEITKSMSNSGAWAHKEFSTTAILCKMQEVVKALIAPAPNNSLIGFKEIRHDAPALDFFETLFPCARYIINYRDDIDAQVTSQETHLSRHLPVDELESDLANKTANLREWAVQRADSSVMLSLEDFSLEIFNGLLQWLSVEGCEYITVSHANEDGFAQDNALPEIKGSCYFNHSESK